MANDLPTMEEAVAGYLASAARFNETVGRLEPGSDSQVRDTASWAVHVFNGYCQPENWSPDGKPHVPIPSGLASDVTRVLLMLLAGHIPQWMLHLQKPGAPTADPRMVRDISFAVAYLKLCSAGALLEKAPTKTVSEAFGVTRRAVQNWMKDYAYFDPSDFFPQAADEAERAELIADEMRRAGARYQKWGRGASNPRPHGKATRRPRAKR